MTIAVFLESYKGKLVKASAETITAAKLLAKKTNSDIFGIALDDNVDEVVAYAGKYGISRVKSSSHVSLYHPTLFARFIANAAKEADYVLIPATVWGREIAPQVTVKLNATPVSDVIEIIDKNIFKRSLHGNKIHVSIEAQGKLVITVRVGIFDVPLETDESATTEDITAETFDGDSLLKLAEVLAASTDDVELTEADIIVSGGRGVAGPENWHLILDLAKLLGAAHGASRAVVDAGWRPHSEQVGQTGKFVSPKVYVAIGISGAIQHLAGMSTSETIVAINKDEEAPIFKVADYGLVGDLFDVVPKLIESIKQVKNS